MDGLSKKTQTLCPVMHRGKNSLHPMGEISDHDTFFSSFVFSSTKM